MYRLTNDTGLAPCIKNNTLSLAVCKGGQIRNGKPCKRGLRYTIGRDFRESLEKDSVYVLGIYKDKFLYLARVTEIMTMVDYFRKDSKGRMDNIYSVKGEKLVRNNHLRKEGVHIDEDQNKRDEAGEYVLLSENYIYLGRDAVTVDKVIEVGPKYQGYAYINGKEANAIIRICEKYRDGKNHLPNKPYGQKCGGCR